jgi:hypothetical protein
MIRTQAKDAVGELNFVTCMLSQGVSQYTAARERGGEIARVVLCFLVHTDRLSGKAHNRSFFQ